MKRAFALPALALLVAAATPVPARAILVSDTIPTLCSWESEGVVQMNCAKPPAQLQTLRTALLRSLVPMSCRPTGVRFQFAGVPISPGRAAGLIATAIVHAPSKNAHFEQTCQPSHW